MNRKIIGICVMTLLIATTIGSSTRINTEENISSFSNDANVPVWEIGDYWTYLINMEVNNDKEKTSGSKYINLEEKLEVVDDSGEYYTLEGTTTFYPGVIQFYLGKLTFINSQFGSHGIDLKLRKSDLGVYTYSEYGEGFLFISIGGIVLPVPIKFEGSGNFECNPVWPLIPFPLFDGKNGNVPGTTYKNIGGYWKLLWGLIPIDFPETEWSHSEAPYTVTEKEISVAAGTFGAYETDIGWSDYYYRPIYSAEVGNVVKYTHHIEHSDGDIIYHSMEMELKDYNYTP